MTAPKVGDRVRVDFEGVVTWVHPRGYGDLAVQPDGATITQAAHVDYCTVIVPPVKVGDVVAAGNIGQLPNKSVIAPRSMTPAYRSGKYWICDGLPYTTAQAACWTARVLRIGGGE